MLIFTKSCAIIYCYHYWLWKCNWLKKNNFISINNFRKTNPWNFFHLLHRQKLHYLLYLSRKAHFRPDFLHEQLFTYWVLHTQQTFNNSDGSGVRFVIGLYFPSQFFQPHVNGWISSWLNFFQTRIWWKTLKTW